MTDKRKFQRRTVVAGLGVAALAAGAAVAARTPLTRWALSAAIDNTSFDQASVSFVDTPACTLTAKAVDGPFYVLASPLRNDIRDGQIGQPLNLQLKFVDASSCVPLAGAVVHIWHANAYGFYSGYPSHHPDHVELTPGHVQVENEERFLRGHQITDAQGRVDFLTICPAWYSFRTPHIHVKVLIDAGTVLTMQLYFPEDLNAWVRESVEPYRARPTPLVSNRSDPVIRASKGAPGGWLKMRAMGQRGYTGTLTIGVLRLAV